MQGAFSNAELFDACIVLFGSGINVSLEFISYLKPEGLRAAYRKKVLETHPDRAVTTGEDAARMNADFIKATMAYRMLSTVVMKDGGIRPLNNAAEDDIIVRRDVPEKETDRGETERFFSGPIPGRKLLICQFLYYSGCISWKTYINALVWQRRRRPPVGQIARDLGLLSEEEIQAVLKQRAMQEKFGESAIRMGYLTPYKLMVLLGKQRRIQRQIGDYFVQSGILTRQKMELMAQKQLSHNNGFP
jgi:hypothetical protein